MDKIATNNFIVGLRKDVKASKSMVAGNLTRKIAELKKKLETLEDADQQSKVQAKIDKVHGDIRLLKTLDTYPICKSAILKPDAKHWDAMVGDSKASPEDILRARVILKGKIQRQVAKFRSEHKDCDEWLEEYFEFREKKREIIEVKKASWKKPQRSSVGVTDRPRGARIEKGHTRGSRKKDKNDRGHPREGNDNGAKAPGTRRAQQRGARANQRDNSRISSKNTSQDDQEQLHPSWASKRREKELLKAALSGKVEPKRLVLNKEN